MSLVPLHGVLGASGVVGAFDAFGASSALGLLSGVVGALHILRHAYIHT